MSATYTELVTAVWAALSGVGLQWSTSAAPVQARATKATGGSGAKVVATLRELSFSTVGRGSEHADSLTTGRLAFTLKPTKASAELNLEAIAALGELGQRAVIKLDGQAGIRASLTSIAATTAEVRVEAALVFGAVIQSTDTDEQLLGRV